jgi:iron complex transport system substrate-binding protein
MLAIAVVVLLMGCKNDKPASVRSVGKDAADAAVNPSWNVSTQGGREFLSDREGNTVALDRQYTRIIVISPGAVETLYLIGAEESIAAITSGRDPVWPEDKTASLPTIGNTARPNLEMAVSFEPDLIIGNSMTAGFIEDLARRGYTVIIHGAESLEDIFSSALLLGRLTGRDAEAASLVAEKRERLEGLKAGLRQNPLGLKGAFLYSASPIMAFTGDSLAGAVLTVLGVENIAAGLSAAQPILQPEYLLAQNPDFLFGAMAITRAEDILAADSVIAQTRAGREMNIRIVASSLFLRPSPRIVEGILELYGIVQGYAPPHAGAEQ